MAALLILLGCIAPAAAAEPPDFNEQVLPVLRKHCTACHNADDREGKLDLSSYDALRAGGASGAVVTPEHADLSRLVRVLTGAAEPKMPPEGSEEPTADELAVLVAWINAGARGPAGASPDPTLLVTPQIPAGAPAPAGLSCLALDPTGRRLAIGRYGRVELRDTGENPSPPRELPCRGRVNGVAFSADGAWVAAAAGEAGLFGEVRLFDAATGELRHTLVGQRDSLYAVRFSPDGRSLAAASYDKSLALWEVATGQQVRLITGHNDALFDLAFHPHGRWLASVSADRTLKLWDVASGQRLDTFGQSLAELFTVAFHPGGEQVAAAGVDNRIRVWRLSPSAVEGDSPLAFSRFAHEKPVLRLAYSPDGRLLVSAGEDRIVKIWDAATVRLRVTLPEQPDWPVGLAITPDSRRLIVARRDGSLGEYSLERLGAAENEAQPISGLPDEVDYGPQPALAELPRIAEQEPNDTPESATPLPAPGVATGRLYAAGGGADVDLYRFECRAGDQWILETKASRAKSPADTKIEVLDAQGRPVPRLLLRAVRDSELEFRSMDSNGRGARLKNWEEMLLDQYVFMNGEVMKHYQQRRGPDSDAQMYPEGGSRHSYFDTTPRAHFLGAPAYIVEPYPADAVLPDNGLPQFVLNYENDDDAERELGRDSRLTFVAPADGAYLIRVSDVRGGSGEQHTYELIVRRPQPTFQVTIAGGGATIGAGSGKLFTVKAQRRDGLHGPIRVDISGAPQGLFVTTPIVIEAGHREAHGMIGAAADAPAPTDEQLAALRVVATATFAGREVAQEVAGGLGAIKTADRPKLLVSLAPAEAAAPAPFTLADGPGEPAEIVIEPGGMVACRLRVARHGFNGRIQFDVLNLPHGVIVDNIGLNGVLIPEGQTERTLYLVAESWVEPSTRLFFAVARAEGDQASLPLQITVRPRSAPEPTTAASE